MACRCHQKPVSGAQGEYPSSYRPRLPSRGVSLETGLSQQWGIDDPLRCHHHLHSALKGGQASTVPKKSQGSVAAGRRWGQCQDLVS